MTEPILYIWFQLAVGIANRLTHEVLSRFESIVDVYNCEDFSFLGEKREKYIKRLQNKDTSEAHEIFKRCKALGVDVTGYYDERFPRTLRKIKIPPAVLYSIGDFRDLDNVPCVGVVGTRKITDYGKAVSEHFAYIFAKSGAYVISGLARGADVCAHRGAVMADGFTVGVLGNPIGEIYPRENEKAFETLYQQGLVISELYPKAPRTRADFPNRNRIIAALSDAIVITEAGETSGSLITAQHAIEQGKPVFAVPGAIGSENAGTNRLIKTGIPAATEPYDVLEPLALEYPEKIIIYEPSVTGKLRSYGNVIKSKPKVVPEREERQNKAEKVLQNTPPEKMLSGKTSERILAVLKNKKPMSADEISIETKLSVSEIMTELTLMEIDGTVIASVGNRYTTVKQ